MLRVPDLDANVLTGLIYVAAGVWILLDCHEAMRDAAIEARGAQIAAEAQVAQLQDAPDA